MDEQESKKIGRPTDFTNELATEICNRIAGGESLRRICEDDDMPCRATVHFWLLDSDKKEFLDQYNHAVNIRTENMFDELNEIADDGRNDYIEKEVESGTITVANPENVARSRLRVDTRKWYLSKVMPKKYGDKVDVTTDGEKINNVTVSIVYAPKPESDTDIC